MVHTSFNLFDLIVLAVVGLSALLSFYRGFLRELLSLGSWIGASVITLYTFPQVSKYIEPQVENAAIASGLAALGVFIASFILVCIISGIILKYVKPGQEIGFLDNMIGLTFGVARGVLLVAIGYFVMSLLLQEKDYPDWVKTSKTRPYVAQAARVVADLAPGYLNAIPKLDMKKIEVPKQAEPTPSTTGNGYHTPTPTMEELKKRMREMDEQQ